MRLLPSDPDIETLVGRIEKSELDLQPDFQRGEVWSQAKRQRLIDSVLRDWHVPPVHVIQNEDQTVSVLDGQQRLAAIRDFMAGGFRVDGALPPFDQKISTLNGKRFPELPFDVQRRFLRFPIRLFTIVDYKPEEPGELFYRLNQLSSLTPAEQRNAFYGATRPQIKTLVEQVRLLGLESLFGFSNARMAFDEIIARSLYLLEVRTLRVKLTASSLADRSRSDRPYSEMDIRRVSLALETMALAQKIATTQLRLNKATAQTWIVFLATASKSFLSSEVQKVEMAEFMAGFEALRQLTIGGEFGDEFSFSNLIRRTSKGNNALFRKALSEFEDRATSRVADASSVVLRDFVVWLFFLSSGIAEQLYVDSFSKRNLARALEGDLSGWDSAEELAEMFFWGGEL
jgi:hypothetical protein